VGAVRECACVCTCAYRRRRGGWRPRRQFLTRLSSSHVFRLLLTRFSSTPRRLLFLLLFVYSSHDFRLLLTPKSDDTHIHTNHSTAELVVWRQVSNRMSLSI